MLQDFETGFFTDNFFLALRVFVEINILNFFTFEAN